MSDTLVIDTDDANRILKWWANARDEWEPTPADDQLAAKLDLFIEIGINIYPLKDRDA